MFYINNVLYTESLGMRGLKITFTSKQTSLYILLVFSKFYTTHSLLNWLFQLHFEATGWFFILFIIVSLVAEFSFVYIILRLLSLFLSLKSHVLTKIQQIFDKLPRNITFLIISLSSMYFQGPHSYGVRTFFSWFICDFFLIFLSLTQF